MSVDYGDVRIGVAVTDPLKIISSAYKTINNNGLESVLSTLKEIVLKENIERIILGHPVGLDGNKTKKTIQVEEFAEKLKELGIEVVLLDESFTTKRAHDILHSMGKKTGNNKDKIDMIAAQVILEDYLRTIE
jgi:putative holliday junction resolvase